MIDPASAHETDTFCIAGIGLLHATLPWYQPETVISTVLAM